MKPLGPPPPSRPNWRNLNRGQRAYALRQYNNALIRRGLPIFNYNNSVAGGGGENSDQPEPTQSDYDEYWDQTDDLDWDYNTSEELNESPSTSSEGVSSAEEPVMSADVSTASKRVADSSPDSTPKKSKSDGMALPGTGSSPDGDPDTGNPSAENAVIPRSISDFGQHTIIFRKHHTFLSYGLAWNIRKLGSSPKHYVTTTSLMSIPVEKPWFYMSPTEYDWLPKGSYIKELHVRVVMRNPRTAFETNSATTTLATLNQNKFITVAQGLNLKTKGVDRYMTFSSGTESMVPTSNDWISIDKQKEVIKAMYGSLTKECEVSEGFKNVPNSFLNLPILLNRYFAITHNTEHKDLGWIQLNKYIEKKDASFLTGKTVANYRFKPKCGLLKEPNNQRSFGYFGDKETGFKANSITTPKNADQLLAVHREIDLEDGIVKQSQLNLFDVDTQEWEKLLGKDAYYKPIEKGQYFRSGLNDKITASVQPSLHVGIYPVPRLTTNEMKIVPEHFTDVEVTWDVDCTAIVAYDYGTLNLTHYPEPFIASVEGAHYFSSSGGLNETYYNEHYSTLDNMYVSRIKTA